MRGSSHWAVLILAFGVLVAVISTVAAQDYLIIKKKDGTVQRVPLQFSPEQIESFQLETGPDQAPKPEQAPPRPETPTPQPPDQQFEPPTPSQQETPGEFEEGPLPEPEPKPMEIQPTPSGQPKIPLRESQPGDQPGETGPTPSGQQPTSQQPPAPDQPPAQVVAKQTHEGSAMTVSIYKLPDNVAELPDYSSARPVELTATYSVNINPETGSMQPSKLPENTDGLGMRIQGFFYVFGEGIFRWRLHSRDGARLNIDDKTLIEHDGLHTSSSKTGYIHLAEGVHSVLLDSFNSAGPPVLSLFVTPPSGPEVVFDSSKGLAGWKEPKDPYDVLWAKVFFVPSRDKGKPNLDRITPIGRTIASEINIEPGGGIPGLPGRKDMVALRYEGFFDVTGQGIFAFRLKSDNYASLTINKDTLIDSLKFDEDGKLAWAWLQEGSYPITVEYMHRKGGPECQLTVTAPEGQEELFTPAKPLIGYKTKDEKVAMIPAFVYFMKPGTNRFPNFNNEEPSGMFFTPAIDYPLDRGTNVFPGAPQRGEWIGLRFYVKFALSEEEAGRYKFRIVAKDGAKLIIGKKIVVNAARKAGTHDESGEITLEKGSHEMFLDFYHTDGPNGLQLFITPPGGEEKIFSFQ